MTPDKDMAKNFKEILDSLPKERQKKIEKLTEELKESILGRDRPNQDKSWGTEVWENEGGSHTDKDNGC